MLRQCTLFLYCLSSRVALYGGAIFICSLRDRPPAAWCNINRAAIMVEKLYERLVILQAEPIVKTVSKLCENVALIQNLGSDSVKIWLKWWGLKCGAGGGKDVVKDAIAPTMLIARCYLWSGYWHSLYEGSVKPGWGAVHSPEICCNCDIEHQICCDSLSAGTGSLSPAVVPVDKIWLQNAESRASQQIKCDDKTLCCGMNAIICGAEIC